METNKQEPQLEHWVATIVGILNEAFILTDDEQYEVRRIVQMLIEKLNIPGRGSTGVVPLAVRQEVFSGYYSDSFGRETPKNPRPVSDVDCVASAEAWRTALEKMILTSYPDVAGDELIMLRKVLTDLLAAIGVPERVAAFFPKDVLSAHIEIRDTV